MSDAKPGDKVKVTYEAEYREFSPYSGRHGVIPAGATVPHPVPRGATVEVIEKADAPAKDPIGTVRRNATGVVAVKTDSYYRCWRRVKIGGWLTASQVADWPIIGAVPGTPAAKAATND